MDITIFFIKNTERIVTLKTFNDSNGVSLRIARFVQYFNDSFGVKNSFDAHSDWAFKIESKSVKKILSGVRR